MGWTKIRDHIWRDEHGAPVLRHTKYQTPNGNNPFPWEHWVDFGNGVARWFSGDGADDGIVHPLIYPRDVFAQADRDEHCWITEGEADAAGARAAGALAVTAGHAGAFGAKHARLFSGWRGRITIMRDLDLPGASGAAKAYDALREVGIPATRLRVARGRVKGKGADLRDHLEAGYRLDEVVGEGIAHVRRLAAQTTTQHYLDAGYDDWGINPVSGHVYSSPTTLGDDLRGWKPVTT